MKKLSLKNLKLEANNMLQRNQLKSVFGGGYGDDCFMKECTGGVSCPGNCKCDTVATSERHWCGYDA